MKKMLLALLLIVFSCFLLCCDEEKKTEVGISFFEKANTTKTMAVVGEKVPFPVVKTIEGYEFLGWSLTENGEVIDTDNALVDEVNTEYFALYKDLQPEVDYYEIEGQLLSTELLADATPHVVENAPELMILGVVLDTFYFFNYESLSGYEYIKVYNNTNSDYNLKNHRIVLANPLQGINIEDDEIINGNKVLSTGYLFAGLIDEDFIIPSCETALIWLKPYYWEAGCGSGAIIKSYSTRLVHGDTPDQKGAFNQTLDDFYSFWHIGKEDIKVYELTNMGFVATRPDSDNQMFPVFTPASGTAYTHLNSKLIRSLEIQKFDDQDGSASISLLINYKTLSEEKKKDPDFVYGKQAFNVMEVIDGDEVIDSYTVENLQKYFKNVCRITFCGRIDTTTLEEGQQYVKFDNTNNPGLGAWENTTELQFQAPTDGSRVMSFVLPVRELEKYTKYMDPTQMKIMKFVEAGSTYRYVKKTIHVAIDPKVYLDTINWRRDELESEGRLSCACPTKVKAVNLGD